VKNAGAQFAALITIEVLQLRVVAPFCSDKNASAFAVGLTAISNAADPSPIPNARFIRLRKRVGDRSLGAAGASADGRGIAAALTLGASAVQLGSAYLRCPESLLPEGARASLGRRPTVMTNLYSGGLARAPRGRLIEEVGAVRSEAPPYPLGGAAAGPLFRAALEQGDFEFMPILAGQAAAPGRALPAAELTRKLAAGALAILEGRA